MNKILGIAVLLAASVFLSMSTDAAEIGTGSPNGTNWLVDVYSDLTLANRTTIGAPAKQVGNYISVTNTDTNAPGSVWVAGSGNSTFFGLWTATYSFDIPTGATGLNLTFSNLLSDDRAMLLVNGTEVGWQAINEATGAGVMWKPVLGSENVVFQAYSSTPVDISSFIHIGSNTLELIVNNTNSASLFADPRSLNGSIDATDAHVQASLNYNVQATPEPATLTLIGTAVLGFIGWRARRRMV